MNFTRRDFIKHTALTSLFLSTLPSLPKNILIGLLDEYDEVVCRKKFKLFIEEGMAKLPIGESIVAIGKSFIGTEYVGGTLDKDTKNEKLVVNLTGLDCVTFVENCLVFGRCVKKGKTSFDDYLVELQRSDTGK
jgi:hypothetical protein